ncbi:MAG: UDP-galactose-lipid carrier transferase [Solirubrobacterales bacterium]|nr:UDP-galactose-lipid carrier transferase [Solirubrobacterales bacterium]
MGRLDEADLSLDYGKKEGRRLLGIAQRRMAAIRLALGGQIGSSELGPPVCVLLEGWDAAGKGGAIKRLVAPIDPRHVRVSQFAAPTPDEARHHFLWRFWPAIPGWGGMAIFDRTWYGRVLVERIEGFARPDEWQRAFGEIRDFEQSLVDEGVIMVKLWMHISAEEQLRRFESRERSPLKRWKLTDEDWRNREKRDAYETAVEEMFERTESEHSRWHVIPGDSKRYARVAVINKVIEEIEAGARRWDFKLP